MTLDLSVPSQLMTACGATLGAFAAHHCSGVRQLSEIVPSAATLTWVDPVRPSSSSQSVSASEASETGSPPGPLAGSPGGPAGPWGPAGPC